MCTNIGMVDETSNPKRKALELITNIFRKKSKDNVNDWHESENYPPLPTIDTPSKSITSVHLRHPVHHNSTQSDGLFHLSPEPSSSSSFHSSDFGIPPHSPVSPRVKNIDEDMEALTLSRQDNPFLSSKLEKLSSGVSEDFLSFSSNLTIQDLTSGDPQMTISATTTTSHLSPSLSTRTPSPGRGGGVGFANPSMISEISHFSETEGDVNLHQHLIRSPPPQFPTKLSHFVFPAPNSPIRNLSSKYGNFLSLDRRLAGQTNNFLGNASDNIHNNVNNFVNIKSEDNLYKSNSSLPINSDKSPIPGGSVRPTRKTSFALGERLFRGQSSEDSRRSSSVSFKNNNEIQLNERNKVKNGCYYHENEKTVNLIGTTIANVTLTPSRSSSNLSEKYSSAVDVTGDDEDDGEDNQEKWARSESSLSNSREALLSARSSLLDIVN